MRPDAHDAADAAPAPPLLRIVRGTPSDEELAALTAVVAALAARAPSTARPRPVTGWGDRTAALRRPVRVGHGAWRSAGR